MGKVKSTIKRFFVQTFRRHGSWEYSEFLTRGIRKSKRTVHKQYPWVYMRFFALMLVLFAVFLLIIRFTSNDLFSPTVMLLSATVFNLPFLLLLYELYPKNDLSFMVVVAVMLIGGTCADVISQVLYSLFSAPDEWLSAVYTGFFEELSKGVVAIVAIVIAGKKNPLAGFLMGAAVGCGYSIVEDLGYIFLYASSLPSLNLTTAISLFIERGLTAFCTHILWSGTVGWAYNFFNRRISNACFYLVLAFVCGLHICWDLPLTGIAYDACIAVCVIAIVSVDLVIVHTSRKKIFDEELTEEDAQVEQIIFTDNLDGTNEPTATAPAKVAKSPEHYIHSGHLCLSICVFLMAVIAIIYCSVPFRENYYSQTFSSKEEFVAFMQEDNNLVVDKDRAFDATLSDEYNERTVVDGELTKIKQHVVKDGYDYYYSYNVISINGNYYYYFAEVTVQMVKNGVYTYANAEDIYFDGKLYVSFFRIRDNVSGYNIDSRGNITAFMYDASFERDLSQPQYTVLFYTFAALGGVGLVLYVAFKIKARSVRKNVER
jgi:RsiW-degrading membrane proteinase PrsW (M82 family)